MVRLLPLILFLACLAPGSGQVDPDKKSSFLLRSIKQTRRISSNHYSDFVLDANGSSYIASFTKGAGNRDYIFIGKVSPEGRLIWEKGLDQAGRATGISIAPDGTVWVLGVASAGLELDDQSFDGAAMFIARLNSEGVCDNLIKAQGSGLACDISVNTRGEVLIAGKMGSELALGEHVLHTAGDRDYGFVALFSQDGKCRQLEMFDAWPQRIRSGQDGSFYITGQFFDTLRFGNKVLRTTGSYDQDGFIAKIDPSTGDRWIQTFGYPGIQQYGYRTVEGGADLLIDGQGNIRVCAIMNPPAGAAFSSGLQSENEFLSTLSIRTYNPEGTLLDSAYILSTPTRNMAFAMTGNEQSGIWISGTSSQYLELGGVRHAFPAAPQSFLLKLNYQTLTPDAFYPPAHGPATLFRVGNVQGTDVYFTGHYRDSLVLEDQRIFNNGEHGLFWLKAKG